MDTKVKKLFTKNLLFSAMLFCLAGCGREESKVPEVEMQEESGLQETGEKTEDIKELPVNFPFYEADSYLLTLA